MEDRTKNTKIPLVCALFCVWIYFFIGSYWSETGIMKNIRIYILSAVVFFAVFGITSLICKLIMKKGVIAQRKKPIETIVVVAIMIFGVIFFIGNFILEVEEFPHNPANFLRHIIPEIIYVLILLALVGSILYFIKNSTPIHNLRCRYIYSVSIAALQGWFLYAPNFFKDTSGGLYHMDAYTNSIINSLSLAPQEQYSMSIYGHYGIFYILPVKLLHMFGLNYWKSVTIAIAFVGFIGFAVEYWILNQIIENDTIFTISVIASAVAVVQIYADQYYQMIPHRYVFQAIILGGALKAFKNKGNKLIKLVMWIISGAAIIWSTDTGLMCAIVWMLASIYLDAQRHGRYSIVTFAKNGLLLICAFLGSFGFVSLYNLAVGGRAITIKTFLYPFGSTTYVIGNFQLSLQIPMARYMVVIFLTLGVIGYYFFEIFKVRLSEKSFVAVLTGIMGFGVFTYYINRAASANISIAGLITVILLAYICDNWLKSDKNIEFRIYKSITPKVMVAVLCLVMLSSMALSTIGTIGVTLRGKISHTYETDTLEEFMTEMKQKIPQKTVAFGMGTAQLFSYMDKETGIYIADWEDLVDSEGEYIINPPAIEYLNNLLDNNKYPFILVNAVQQRYLDGRGYEECYDLEYNGNIFKLYELKNY